MTTAKEATLTGIIKRFIMANIAFGLIAWVLCIATPFDIVASNSGEFKFAPGFDILYNGIVYGALVFALLNMLFLGIVLIFRGYVQGIFVKFFLAIAISFWLNSTFLVGAYGEFDGKGNLDIEAFGYLGWIQVSAFFAVFLLALALSKYVKIINYAVGLILIISVLTGSVNIASKIFEPKIKKVQNEEFFKYSSKNPNVLVFLLDEYQSDYFANALDDGMKEDLEGFIWYRDNVGNFASTVAAMPSLFTGDVYDNQIDIADFYDSQAERSIASVIASKGGNVYYTQPPLMLEHLFPEGSYVNLPSLDIKNLSTYTSLINYSLFRAVPDLLKGYVYNDESWLIQLSGNDPYRPAGYVGESYKKLKYLASQQIAVLDDYPMTFRFHYSYITHRPTRLGAECQPFGSASSNLENKTAEGLCAINTIVEAIKNLKEADVFDNTMIVILADHGSIFTPNNFGTGLPYSPSAATLLIKPLQQKSKFIISEYPSQSSDVPKTIATAINIENDYKGVDLLNAQESEKRTRVFNHYQWARKDGYWTETRVPPLIKFYINGSVKDPDNWTLDLNQQLVPLQCGNAVDFFDNEQRKHYFQMGMTRPRNWGRGIVKTTVQVYFAPEACKPNRLKFTLHATSKETPMKVANVFVNEQPVGQVTVTSSDKDPKEFIFDLPELTSSIIDVRFDIGRPTSGASNDISGLGFGFISAELIQD